MKDVNDVTAGCRCLTFDLWRQSLEVSSARNPICTQQGRYIIFDNIQPFIGESLKKKTILLFG